jgi:hypothetical protein
LDGLVICKKNRGSIVKGYGCSGFKIGSRTRSQFVQSLGGLTARIFGIYWIYELIFYYKSHGLGSPPVDRGCVVGSVVHRGPVAGTSGELTGAAPDGWFRGRLITVSGGKEREDLRDPHRRQMGAVR